MPTKKMRKSNPFLVPIIVTVLFSSAGAVVGGHMGFLEAKYLCNKHEKQQHSPKRVRVKKFKKGFSKSPFNYSGELK